MKKEQVRVEELFEVVSRPVETGDSKSLVWIPDKSGGIFSHAEKNTVSKHSISLIPKRDVVIDLEYALYALSSTVRVLLGSTGRKQASLRNEYEHDPISFINKVSISIPIDETYAFDLLAQKQEAIAYKIAAEQKRIEKEIM